MRSLRFFLATLFTFFLVIFFSSFLFYSSLLIAPLFFIILFVFLYNIIEDNQKTEGVFLAVISGFVVDIFIAGTPVGLYTLLFFVLAYFTKVILKKYVRVSAFS